MDRQNKTHTILIKISIESGRGSREIKILENMCMNSSWMKIEHDSCILNMIFGDYPKCRKIFIIVLYH